jgi:hypothetical protein
MLWVTKVVRVSPCERRIPFALAKARRAIQAEKNPRMVKV